MTPANLLTTLTGLLHLPREHGTVEFKSNLVNPQELGEYISALANTAALNGHDRGWIVWGVGDGTHAILGTDFDPFTRKVGGNGTLVMWLQMMTQPRADFEFHEIAHPQGRVVMLEICPARSAPIGFQHTHIRLDSHKVKLSEHPDKEARLWARLGLKEDWSGALVPDATLDHLDPEALAAARVRFIEYLVRSEVDPSRHDAIRAEAATWSDETLLNKARINKQGRITRSALLLLGRDEAAHFLAPVDAKISWILRDAENATLTSQAFSASIPAGY